MDATFISTGFTNWKDATSVFRKHEASECHRAAVESIGVLPMTTRDVGELLCDEHKKEKAENRAMLLKILSNIWFLCRQGLPLRGHGDGSDSNFIQTLKFQSECDFRVSLWLERKGDKFTSPQIQSKMIKIMGLLRDVISSIQATPFITLMADETTDCTNKEQVVIVLRWVDEDLVVHEDFIGMYEVESIETKVLVTILQDAGLITSKPVHAKN